MKWFVYVALAVLASWLGIIVWMFCTYHGGAA